MTTKNDFSTEQWDIARTLPVMAIAGAVFADGRKLITSMSETVSGFETYRSAAAQFPDNELLQAFVSSEEAGVAKPVIPKDASMTEAVDAILSEVQKAVDIVQPQADAQEWQQVGEVLMAAATAAAERKGSGVLGFGGDKIQPEEQAYLDQLARILGQSFDSDDAVGGSSTESSDAAADGSAAPGDDA